MLLWDNYLNQYISFERLILFVWKTDFLSACLLLKQLQQPGLDETTSRSQELYLGLPYGWQEPKILDLRASSTASQAH